jgi:murein DD-endopeptidase MepM/ murein hydrolase activator NlpD
MALLACLPALATAQRLMDWRERTTPPSITIPAHADEPAPQPWLQVEDQGEIQQVWLANPLGGPAQVRLHDQGGDGFRAVPALPVILELKAGERRLATRIYPLQPANKPLLGLNVDAIPGSPRGHADDVVYQLPFASTPVRIDQGFGGSFSHTDPANFYALDFALPKRTPVLAARDGVVMEVRDDFREAGTDPTHFGNGANLVRILHSDGSMAIYAHLAPGGIQVRIGQTVHTGDELGLSGNTGLSTGPHLHFAVQLNRSTKLVSVPFRMAGPLGELRFAHPAGTATGTAQPGSPL